MLDPRSSITVLSYTTTEDVRRAAVFGVRIIGTISRNYHCVMGRAVGERFLPWTRAGVRISQGVLNRVITVFDKGPDLWLNG